MSFLRSPITAGPVRPSLAFFHINHTVFVFLFLCFCFCLYLAIFFIFIISNYNTTLSSGADWWIIDKPPVF